MSRSYDFRSLSQTDEGRGKRDGEGEGGEGGEDVSTQTGGVLAGLLTILTSVQGFRGGSRHAETETIKTRQQVTGLRREALSKNPAGHETRRIDQ